MNNVTRLTLAFIFTLTSWVAHAQTNCAGQNLTIELLTDNYGQETDWALVNNQGTSLASGSDFESNTLYTQQVCLSPGSYDFTISDSYGDGICCDYGNGYYQLSLDNQSLASGGSFNSQASHTIVIEGDTTPSCTNHALELTLSTDNYGNETAWTLSSGGTLVDSGDGYSSNQQYSASFCLTDGDYRFTITDSYGDGMCCDYGNGQYELSLNGTVIANGGEFTSSDITDFSLPLSGGGGNDDDLEAYYATAAGLTGTALKDQLYQIISGHTTRSYGALWDFYLSYETDNYYENNYTILDIYSENPTAADPYTFTPGSDQCGSYNSEADCYNREHSFPRSWFGGSVAPMNSDVHHIFATDGQVNAWRGSYPYGEVSNPDRTSQNGSKLGSARSGLGYSGTVFEPIDEFKGDLARAYFYMATRYQDRISQWQSNSTYGDAILDGSSDVVFENWHLQMLLQWHNEDPVSQKEIDRNDAAQIFQGNRNPFVDHPEWVEQIW